MLRGHSSGVTSVAFSPDSMTLVSGGADNSVRQWNARTGQQLAMMQVRPGDGSSPRRFAAVAAVKVADRQLLGLLEPLVRLHQR